MPTITMRRTTRLTHSFHPLTGKLSMRSPKRMPTRRLQMNVGGRVIVGKSAKNRNCDCGMAPNAVYPRHSIKGTELGETIAHIAGAHLVRRAPHEWPRRCRGSHARPGAPGPGGS